MDFIWYQIHITQFTCIYFELETVQSFHFSMQPSSSRMTKLLAIDRSSSQELASCRAQYSGGDGPACRGPAPGRWVHGQHGIRPRRIQRGTHPPSNRCFPRPRKAASLSSPGFDGARSRAPGAISRGRCHWGGSSYRGLGTGERRRVNCARCEMGGVIFGVAH